jgi:hypothetical protein
MLKRDSSGSLAGVFLYEKIIMYRMMLRELPLPCMSVASASEKLDTAVYWSALATREATGRMAAPAGGLPGVLLGSSVQGAGQMAGCRSSFVLKERRATGRRGGTASPRWWHHPRNLQPAHQHCFHVHQNGSCTFEQQCQTTKASPKVAQHRHCTAAAQRLCTS